MCESVLILNAKEQVLADIYGLLEVILGKSQ